MARVKGTGASLVSGACVKCGRWCDEVPGHHIVNRGMGGRKTNPGPEVPACPLCHRYIHDHPAEAYANGWLYREATPEGRALLGYSFESDPWIFRRLAELVTAYGHEV